MADGALRGPARSRYSEELVEAHVERLRRADEGDVADPVLSVVAMPGARAAAELAVAVAVLVDYALLADVAAILGCSQPEDG